MRHYRDSDDPVFQNDAQSVEHLVSRARLLAREWQAINGLDYDFSTADILYRVADEDESFTGFKTFSQEFRLSGSTERVDWLVGAFYADETLDRNEGYRVGAAYEPYLSIALLSRINPLLATSPTAPLLLSQSSGRPFGTVFAGHAASDRYAQDARSLGLFTNNTWHATEALDLTLGLRYTREKKTLVSNYSNPNGGAGCGAMLANPAQVVAALVARGATEERPPQLAARMPDHELWTGFLRDPDGNKICAFAPNPNA